MRGWLLILACWALAVPAVWAHTVVTDGTIGMTMHIDPDDAPVAGVPSRFDLWFRDLSGRLDAGQCDGSFSVSRAGSLVGEPQVLFPPGTKTAAVGHSLTFPAPGVYTVTIEGTPRGTARFSPFRLVFDVRVSGDGSAPAVGPADPLPYVASALLAVALLLCWGFWPRRSRP